MRHYRRFKCDNYDKTTNAFDTGKVISCKLEIMTNNCANTDGKPFDLPGFPDDKACSTSGKRRMHDSERVRLCVVGNSKEDLRMAWNANDSVDVMVVTNLTPG